MLRQVYPVHSTYSVSRGSSKEDNIESEAELMVEPPFLGTCHSGNIFPLGSLTCLSVSS